jgi:outer membrane protein OmpA-like peptidoglycan-associated protein
MSVKKTETFGAPFNPGPPLNTKYNETQPCIAENGRIIYFASDRPGGSGDMDIWWSRLGRNGKWEEPVNAGPVINTPWDELTPFLHFDGSSFYFTSAGHAGYGETDIFFSSRSDDGAFTPPVNCGAGINTKETEANLIVLPRGNTGYFVSDRNAMSGATEGYGRTDIWEVHLDEMITAHPTSWCAIRTVDAITRSPIQAEIYIQDLGRNTLFGIKQTQLHQEAIFSLPGGVQLAVNAEAKGYVLYSGTITTDTSSVWQEPQRITIELQKIETTTHHAPVVLKNVLFYSATDSLLNVSVAELTRLLQFLKENPRIVISIEGHTDDVGTEPDNLMLSEKRAQAVGRWLIRYGVAPERLKYRGWGEAKPIAPNDSESGRQQNRRTEFVIIDR